MMVVQIPGQAVKDTGDDLAQPINDLLQSVSLESKEDPTEPMAMIKADALDLTKWVAGLLGVGGALSGVFATFVAWNAGSGHEPLKVALVAATGLIISTAVLMVGWVTTSDVRARAQTQQARYAARGRVIRDYLELVEKADLPQREAAAVEVMVDRRLSH